MEMERNPIDMSGPNNMAPGDYVVSIEIHISTSNCHCILESKYYNCASTGNETVEIDLNQTHIANDDPGSVNVSITGLNSSQSYSIEWMICLGNRTVHSAKTHADYVDANEIMHQQ